MKEMLLICGLLGRAGYTICMTGAGLSSDSTTTANALLAAIAFILFSMSCDNDLK